MLKGDERQVKARYDRMAKSTGFDEADQVWLYRPTRNRGMSSKL
jgi:hypothetical protein